MTSTKNAGFEHLQQRIKQLEATEREYNQIKELLANAAKNEQLEKFDHNIVIYSQPDDGKIFDANDSACQFLGYSLEEFLTLTIDQLQVSGSQGEVRVYIESSIQVQEYDCAYWHRDGYKLAVRCRNWAIAKNGKELLCYTLEDKSLRTQLWHELSRREDRDYQFREKLKTLNEITIELGRLDSFDDICLRAVEFGIEKLGFDRISLWFLSPSKTLMTGTFGVDEEGNIRDERGQSWSFINTYSEEFVNGRRDPFITKDSAPLYNEKSEIIGYGWHLSVPILDRGEFIGFIGTDNYIHRQPLKNYEPELLRFYGATIGHLTVRQLEQETIRKLSSAIQHSSSMVLVLNKQQVIEFANDAYCRVSSYALDEILGQTIDILFTAEDLQIIRASLLSGGSWQGELVNKKKDGTHYEAIVSISPVGLGDATENFVIVQEDITMLKQVRKNVLALQLEQERAGLLETFVTDISHEFKTPLAVINTSSYILSKSEDEAKRTTHSNMIKTQVNNLNQMLDDSLEIVKITSVLELNLEKFRLAGFVQAIIDRLILSENEKALQWQIELESPIEIEADAHKLTRIIHEVLENAIQFTPEQGAISVSLYAQTQQAKIVIEDTGIGIADEEIEKIFDRFYRIDKARSTRNTGLGLAVVKLLVDAHHGQIKVESVLGQGSRFEILLPLEQQ